MVLIGEERMLAGEKVQRTQAAMMEQSMLAELAEEQRKLVGTVPLTVVHRR